MIQRNKNATGIRLNAHSVPWLVTIVFLAVASSVRAAVVDFRLAALSAPSGSDTAATVPVSQPNTTALFRLKLKR